MKNRQQTWKGLIYASCILVMILDSKTAVSGANEGIMLCLYTVIPSLFPFIILSILLNSSLIGSSVPLLRPVGKLCGIPEGSESILLLGFLGGYPVGAQAVVSAWQDGKLTNQDAKRMLGFCSNAGPAFIFGMASGLFSNPVSVWILWAIHIISALTVALLLPGRSKLSYQSKTYASVSFSSAIEKSIKIMANICGWVVIFRVILAFLDRWLLWYFPIEVSIGISGVLELANGCIGAYDLVTEGARFLFLSAFLGFGGLCVYGQTVSVTKGLGIGAYFPGKVLQGSISILLAYCVQWFLFPNEQIYKTHAWPMIFTIVLVLWECFFISRKKTVAIPKKIIYNKLKFTS